MSFTSFFIFFCKQKTAYEMRISDWSSDVCSSDLELPGAAGRLQVRLARCHEADVERDGHVRSQPLDAARLDGAQQLHLQGERHGLALVETNGAAVGDLKLAGARLLPPGDGDGVATARAPPRDHTRYGPAVSGH